VVIDDELDHRRNLVEAQGAIEECGNRDIVRGAQRGRICAPCYS
jgi:hypothetical protein